MIVEKGLYFITKKTKIFLAKICAAWQNDGVQRLAGFAKVDEQYII